MNLKINVKKGKIAPEEALELLANILGGMFDAEEIEIECFDRKVMFPAIQIKTHINIEYAEMTLLRRVRDRFYISVREEVECMDKINRVSSPTTRLVVSFIPTDFYELENKNRETEVKEE